MEVTIPIGKTALSGNLSIPDKAHSLVLFAHGSGSSRLSPRNQFVARYLEKKGLGTLLFDLLTQEEEELRFDISLLAKRLILATDWAKRQTPLPICYFGASTGAAAALVAAAEKKDSIKAVVSRGGRPDLAMEFLPRVEAPTLLIVGELDIEVIDLNKKAFDLLKCKKKMEIVPNATHLFEEEGALEAVAKLAANWFLNH